MMATRRTFEDFQFDLENARTMPQLTGRSTGRAQHSHMNAEHFDEDPGTDCGGSCASELP